VKKLLFFGLFIVAFWSCSVDENEEFRFEILPIKTVEMPTSVKYNEFYSINYTYLKPSTCHMYNNLYYTSLGNYRTVAVVNNVVNPTAALSCEPLTENIEERSFTFHVQNVVGTYVFRFWQGEDENGQDSYLVFEVPVE